MKNNIVRTRFAPSPTGDLHIGSVRTALFNFLFAKHHQGSFLLRIEDTDLKRSDPRFVDGIMDSLRWLGLLWDKEPIFQSQRFPRYREIATQMILKGKAYYCFLNTQEVESFKTGEQVFRSPWRDQNVVFNGFEYVNKTSDINQISIPVDVNPVIRLKVPGKSELELHDLLQGKVKVDSTQVEDLVLVKSDGNATYMLSVVVDDHDMEITHIIRGDDHLTNAFKQILIYQGMEWNTPAMIHIPLIHGSDGAKLSKRHGAVSASEYKTMFLPEAINNYLLRLGWGHGDAEIISMQQAIAWFDIKGLGKAPARLDFDKLTAINSHYIKNASDQELLNILKDAFIAGKLSHDPISGDVILKALESIKVRAKTIPEIIALASIYLPWLEQKPYIDKDMTEVFSNLDAIVIDKSINLLSNLTDNSKESIQNQFNILASALNMKIGNLMKNIRPLVTGMLNSPSVFEIISIIGIEETIKRLRRFYDL